MPLSKRGKEIFLPRFIQAILNYKLVNLIELPGIKKTKISYAKSVSKTLFSYLNSKNKVDVALGVTSHMRSIFQGYPLDQPTYGKLNHDVASVPKAIETLIQSNLRDTNLAIAPSSKTIDDSMPNVSSSQKDEARKRRRRIRENKL